VTTTAGQKLTLVNPAYMTRQVYELAANEYGVQGHITSLKPLRPTNAADPWEAAALRRFEDGLTEIVELIPGATPVHRYMAPLKVTEACLACHSQQQYQLGQIRGGISVTMPAAVNSTPTMRKMSTLPNSVSIGRISGTWRDSYRLDHGVNFKGTCNNIERTRRIVK